MPDAETKIRPIYQSLIQRKSNKYLDSKRNPHISQSKQTTVKEKNYAKKGKKDSETNKAYTNLCMFVKTAEVKWHAMMFRYGNVISDTYTN